MPLTEQQIASLSALNIFTIGVYDGRTEDPYSLIAGQLPLERVIEIVKKRAEKDGQWCIDNDLVGDNEDKMRKMIAFTCDPKMVEQAVKHPSNAGATVDFVCRDLANASKWNVNS